MQVYFMSFWKKSFLNIYMILAMQKWIKPVAKFIFLKVKEIKDFFIFFYVNRNIKDSLFRVGMSRYLYVNEILFYSLCVVRSRTNVCTNKNNTLSENVREAKRIKSSQTSVNAPRIDFYVRPIYLYRLVFFR